MPGSLSEAHPADPERLRQLDLTISVTDAPGPGCCPAMAGESA
jgi:hypothetical protein